MAWNQSEFDNARRKFEKYFPDFDTFDRPGERYVEAERGDKDKLVALYDADVRPLTGKSDADFFKAFINVLSRSQKQQFVGGRVIYALGKLRDSESSKFGMILKRVIESEASSASITTYGEDASRLLKSISIPKTPPSKADIRNILSLLLMLHNPKKFISLTYWNAKLSAKPLLGKMLIEKDSQVTGEEFEECQEFASRVSVALENAGLFPKDMIDVHSFLYQAFQSTGEKLIWNQREFKSSVEAFKRHYRGFEDFSNCGEPYLNAQNKFKENIRNKYNTSLKPFIESDPVAFFNAYAEIVEIYTAHRPSESADWSDLTKGISDKIKTELGSILQSLLTSAEGEAWNPIVAEYDQRSKQLLEGDSLASDSHNIREMRREFATLLLALRWPQKYIHAARMVWNTAGKRFLGREIISSRDGISAGIFKELADFTRQISDQLKEENLLSRRQSNKFDIHSFLWFIFDESNSQDNPSVLNKQNLGHVDAVVHEKQDLSRLIEVIRSEEMRIGESVIRQYHFSMRTRGFVILAGPSGAGKTWLTRLYANAVDANYLLAPVAPNWSTNEDLLGFFNPIDGKFHATAFLDFIDQAAKLWKRVGSSAKEFHLILDEMNLARVEHYFSLFLSLMERRRETEIPETRLTGNRVVRLPPNLKFAGTVNMDETTHGFADKVFDRAQLIELSISPDAAREHVSERIGDAPSAEVLLDLWERMAPACPVGFRVLDEIAEYLELAEQEAVDWREALDEQIVSKLLPKLRGIDPEVAEVLKLVETRVNGEFPRSAAKCQSMLRRARSTDVVSFF